MHQTQIEEMLYFGVTTLGKVLSDEMVAALKADVLQKKEEDIAQVGKEALIKIGDYETVRDLARFGGLYFTVLENDIINDCLNTILNSKAVVHSYNAIINRHDAQSKMVGFDFHRDQPFYKDTRTSIIVMIPLVDFSKENGSTQYIPGGHLFEQKPSEAFIEKHKVHSQGKAGEAIVVDASCWHAAGKNSGTEDRPMLTLKYTLAPFKQQVDFCRSAAAHLESASELVKQRLGWNARVCETYAEYREPNDVKKFKSGQYDMTNTYYR